MRKFVKRLKMLQFKHLFSNKILGLRVSAIFEIAVFIFIVVCTAYFTGNDNRFFDVNPSPYWIIIVFISAQYGVNEAIFSALVCSLVLLVGNLPTQNIDQTTYGYYLYIIINPLMWFITSVLLGLLRSKHIMAYQQAKIKYEESTQREKEITHGYNRLKSVKEMLEKKLAGQLTSASHGYSIISQYQTLSDTSLLEHLPKIIEETLKPKSFSIFLAEGKGFYRKYYIGWEDSDSYSKEIKKNSYLYRAIITEEYLSVTKREHQEILGSEGVLACKLVNKNTGNVFGLLKIESLDFLDLNTSTISTFVAICDWVGTAYSNSIQYGVVEDNQFIDRETGVYTKSYYNHQRDFLLVLSERYCFPLYRLEMSIHPLDIVNINPLLSLVEVFKEVFPPDVVVFSSGKKEVFYSLVRSSNPEKIQGYILDLDTQFRAFTENKAELIVSYKRL